MQESSPQEIRPGSPPPRPAQDPGSFTLKRRFPGEAPVPGAAPAPPPPSVKKPRLPRIVLPLILLVLVVGGIAYVAQNLPSWRKAPQQGKVGKGPGGAAALLTFPATRDEDGRIVAIWDAADPTYAVEIEQGSKGHYEFLCLNASEHPVEIGVVKLNCDCSKASFAVLPPGMTFSGKQPDAATLAKELPKDLAWQTLRWVDDKGKHEDRSAVLPAQRAGLVRVDWYTRKSDGEALNLQVTLWAQTEGSRSKERQYYMLDTLTVIVQPLQFDRGSIHLGEVGLRGARAQFHCWSATRSKVELTLADQDDPLFQWQVTPLSPEECSALEKKVNGKMLNTRIKSAYRVGVQVHESKDGRQLDQGSFIRQPPLLVDGSRLEYPGPRIEGIVRGDVQITGDVRNGTISEGQVRFSSFKSSEGTHANLELSAPHDVTLAYVSKSPPYLDVRLTETKKVVKGKKIWRLEIVVPQQVPTGPLPADSAIVLSKTTQGALPRQIRIPILGIAVQG